MLAFDFEYDGATLSNLGYMICTFDSGGMNTIENGSQITFNTVPLFGGAKYELTSTVYDSCLETTFQICKAPCASELTECVVDSAITEQSAVGIIEVNGNDELDISVAELRSLMRWLNRKGFHKFKLIDDEYADIYFEGSFNISRIESDNRLVGLELTLITNRPFGLLEPVTITLENSSSNGTVSFEDISDEEGFIYPYTQITIAESGNLTIYSELEGRSTYIANCTAGEVLTFDYPIISSSVSSHKVQDDFNWLFPRIANSLSSNINQFTVSIPCTIKMTYSPIAKVGL